MLFAKNDEEAVLLVAFMFAQVCQVCVLRRKR